MKVVIFLEETNVQTVEENKVDLNVSERNWLVTLLFVIFLGTLGIHRFYVGKIGTGILMLITFGGFGVWTLIDLIIIAMGQFKDIDGKVLKVEVKM
jgi:TM2 domain-containing membrane protein YozV